MSEPPPEQEEPPEQEPPPGPAPSPAQLAVTMFTIIPVPFSGPVDGTLASRAIRWLPAVGLLLAVPATAALLLAQLGGDTAARRLLGAVLAVAVLAVLTGGLHLDGLADTADGLASRRPRDKALEIMRMGNTGPLGVTALVLTVLLQVTALAALPTPLAVTGLVLAAVTARTAVIVATGPWFPAARPAGFGALVAGRTPARVCLAAAAALLMAAWAVGQSTAGQLITGTLPGVRLAAAAAAGLLVASGVCGAARRGLGGLTGDVFGAVIELSTATTLVALVVLS